MSLIDREEIKEKNYTYCQNVKTSMRISHIPSNSLTEILCDCYTKIGYLMIQKVRRFGSGNQQPYKHNTGNGKDKQHIPHQNMR